MHKVQESPSLDYLAGPRGQDLLEPAEWDAFCEEASARDAAMSADGPAIEWPAFEAWVRARLAERISALPPSLMPGT